MKHGRLQRKPTSQKTTLLSENLCGLGNPFLVAFYAFEELWSGLRNLLFFNSVKTVA